jgi:tRNA(Ile2) C34 agmatinyltransferase TiaS
VLRAEVIEEDNENPLMDYEDSTEATANSKYRCRECGMLFDTLDEHDEHHRTVHSRVEDYPNQGMTM